MKFETELGAFAAILACAVFTVLFIGSPDLHDAWISYAAGVSLDELRLLQEKWKEGSP